MAGLKRNLWFVFVLIAVSTARAEDLHSADQAWARIKAETGFPLAGDYVLVSQRSASPAASEGKVVDQQRSISFGPTLRWLDGQSCPEWWPSVFKGIPFDLHDPNLSDLIIGPLGARSNHRLSLLYRISCKGDDLGWLVVIDKRVAIVPSADGTGFAIFALPLAESLIRRIQEGLAKAGLHGGPSTGELDERTSSAIAEYAQQRGAAYRFSTPVMTMNLLDGLGALGAEVDDIQPGGDSGSGG